MGLVGTGQVPGGGMRLPARWTPGTKGSRWMGTAS